MTPEELLALSCEEFEALPVVDARTNCTNCLRCTNCAGCTDCLRCADCLRCTNCLRCADCTNCLRCEDCKDCEGCIGIKNGRGLRYLVHGVQLTAEQFTTVTARQSR